MERSDGRPARSSGLAPVSYLFGVPDADQAAPDAAAPNDVAPDEAELDGAASADAAASAAQDAALAALQAAAVAAAQALDAARAEAAAAVRAAEQLPPERPRAAPRLRAVTRDTDSGWYVDPLEEFEQHSPLASPAETAALEPAGAVAAVRAFLSTVESQTAAGAPASSGVRFVADDDDDADDADSTGRTKPPPVRQASINALARKGMSSAEMTDLLEAREVDPDEVVLEVSRLEAAGLLDDRVLAEHLVRTLQERKGLGRSAINAELRRRKVDQAAIDEALDTVDVDDELERCLEVAVKRASQLRSYDRPTAERRLSAFLMRRGYAGSVISTAVAQALGPVGPRFR